MTISATYTSKYQQALFALGHHTYNTTDDYPSAVTVYRKILARSFDKVSIVSLGFLYNLEALLKSNPDEWSPLTGMELVAEKVDCIFIMGGKLPSGSGEYNFSANLAAKTSSKYVVENAPCKLLFLGESQGMRGKDSNYIKVGANMKDIYSSGSEDALYQCYIDYASGGGEDVVNNGRYAWDPLTTYIGIIGDATRCGWDVYRGTYSIDAEYNGTFTVNTTGNHYYVQNAENASYYVNQINSKLFDS